MDLKDRVVLIAGGTGTLGIAIARALATAGAHIGFTYLERKDAARETTRPSSRSADGRGAPRSIRPTRTRSRRSWTRR